MKRSSGYSVYRGDTYRRQQPQAAPKRHLRRWVVAAGLLVVIAVATILGGGRLLALAHHTPAPQPKAIAAVKATAVKKPLSVPAPVVTPAPVPQPQPTHVATECDANTSGGKLIIVSISKRHLWACDATAVSYDSPVVTGMEQLAADLTPRGTFHIVSKQTNLHLIGSDSTGHWDDFVNYWMPFLNNQYGTYGFHDATWRADSDFGNIDPNSSNASHGCVELPLATAKWIYDWAPVGTTLTIES